MKVVHEIEQRCQHDQHQHHPVHGVDQATDLVAVQWRNEHAVQQPMEFGGDFVGGLLGGNQISGVLLA